MSEQSNEKDLSIPIFDREQWSLRNALVWIASRSEHFTAEKGDDPLESVDGFLSWKRPEIWPFRLNTTAAWETELAPATEAGRLRGRGRFSVWQMGEEDQLTKRWCPIELLESLESDFPRNESPQPSDLMVTDQYIEGGRWRSVLVPKSTIHRLSSLQRWQEISFAKDAILTTWPRHRGGISLHEPSLLDGMPHEDETSLAEAVALFASKCQRMSPQELWREWPTAECNLFKALATGALTAEGAQRGRYEVIPRGVWRLASSQWPGKGPLVTYVEANGQLESALWSNPDCWNGVIVSQAECIRYLQSGNGNKVQAKFRVDPLFKALATLFPDGLPSDLQKQDIDKRAINYVRLTDKKFTADPKTLRAARQTYEQEILRRKL